MNPESTAPKQDEPTNQSADTPFAQPPTQNPFQASQAAVAPVSQEMNPAPQNTTPPLSPTTPKRSKLPTLSLVFGIIGVVLALIIFVSVPAAIAAIIIGAVALKKKVGDKGKSVAGIVLGSLSLVIIIPLLVIITLVAYNGIQERAQRAVDQANSSGSSQTSDSANVDEPCYRFALPSGYTVSRTDGNCEVTLSDGTDEINVTPITGEVPSLSEARSILQPFATSAEGTLSQGEERMFNDVTAYKFTIDYSAGTFALYLFIDESGAHEVSGQTVTGYSVTGRSDSFDSRVTLELITDTFTLKG